MCILVISGQGLEVPVGGNATGSANLTMAQGLTPVEVNTECQYPEAAFSSVQVYQSSGFNSKGVLC